MFRVGIGYDVHRFAQDRKLIIGGVDIPYPKGLLGHSDADVLLHAIMDAILGAMGLGDIGQHFPDNDMVFKDISSRVLLKNVANLLAGKGYVVENIDSVIVAQAPKILPYSEEMKQNIAEDLGISSEQVNVKATTTERLGFEGREEGISSQAVVLLKKLQSE